MTKIVLQVPIDVSLRNAAEEASREAGFSSVQEVVRVFLSSFSKKKMTVNFTSQKLPEGSTPIDELIHKTIL